MVFLSCLPALAASALVCGSATEVLGRESGAVQGVVADVKIGRLEELVDNPQADRELADLLLVTYNERRRAEGIRNPPEQLAVTARITKALAGFSERHPKTKAALLAKYLIGEIVSQGLFGHSRDLCRACFQDLVVNYPKTKEATLAQLTLMRLSVEAMEVELGGRNGEDGTLREKLRQSGLRLREALKVALPVAEQVDRDPSPLMVAFRRAALLTPAPQFVAGFKLDIAVFSERLGERDVARKLYEEITHDYPRTAYAQSAKNRLQSMKIEDELEKQGEHVIEVW